MRYTGNPIADFHRHDSEQESQLEKLPKCDYGGEAIQDDNYYDIDGYILCEEHMNELYRKRTEDFIS